MFQVPILAELELDVLNQGVTLDAGESHGIPQDVPVQAQHNRRTSHES